MKRIEFIDVAKGVTILSVILGHTIPAGFVRTLIYSFHMPLFFFLSGFFFRPLPRKTLARRKSRQLLFPYFLTCLLLILGSLLLLILKGRAGEIPAQAARLLFASFYASGTDIPAPYVIPQIGAIWFLWALFFAFLILNRLLHLRFAPLLVTLTAVFGIITGKLLWMPLSIQAAMTAVFYLWLGYLAKEKDAVGYFRRHPYFLIPCLPLWLPCAAFGGEIVMAHNEFPCLPLNLVSSLTGILLVLFLCGLLCFGPRKLTDFFIKMGTHTLLILCVHLLELRLLPWYLVRNILTGPLSLPLWPASLILAALKITLAWAAVTIKIKRESHFGGA